MDQIGTGFHIFLPSFFLPASPFISRRSSIPSTSTCLCLLSLCCHVGCRSHANSMCERACSCRNTCMCPRACVWLAVVFTSGRLPRRSAELHIKQAALSGLSSSLDRPCQLGEGGWGLASNFLTQKLPPGRFPLSLLPQLPHSSAFLFNTHSPNPIDLSWRGKQAKCAVAAQWDQNRASKSRFTSLVDRITPIRAEISNSKQDTAEAVYEWQHKESVIQKRGPHGRGLWGLDT